MSHFEIHITTNDFLVLNRDKLEHYMANTLGSDEFYITDHENNMVSLSIKSDCGEWPYEDGDFSIDAFLKHHVTPGEVLIIYQVHYENRLSYGAEAWAYRLVGEEIESVGVNTFAINSLAQAQWPDATINSV